MPSSTTLSKSRVEPLQLVEALEHPGGLVEPAEPLRLVCAGPDGRVARPDPVDELDSFQRAHAGASCSRFDSMPSSSSVNESMNFWTPSRSSVSLTSS